MMSQSRVIKCGSTNKAFQALQEQCGREEPPDGVDFLNF